MDFGQIVLEGVKFFTLPTLALLAVIAPAYFVARLEIRKRGDPLYLKEVGVIIKKLDCLDAVADVIGRYGGVEIYRYVIFKGMRYSYDRIVPASYRNFIGAKELFLEPGVVYVTTD
ncbi:MAG: hypothetical protein HYU77_11285 [Betaproteobacteria bacterium]|nr:hypothetical protein [Betaproteobacteria bacterium]